MSQRRLCIMWHTSAVTHGSTFSLFSGPLVVAAAAFNCSISLDNWRISWASSSTRCTWAFFMASISAFRQRILPFYCSIAVVSRLAIYSNIAITLKLFLCLTIWLDLGLPFWYSLLHCCILCLCSLCVRVWYMKDWMVLTSFCAKQLRTRASSCWSISGGGGE